MSQLTWLVSLPQVKDVKYKRTYHNRHPVLEVNAQNGEILHQQIHLGALPGGIAGRLVGRFLNLDDIFIIYD